MSVCNHTGDEQIGPPTPHPPRTWLLSDDLVTTNIILLLLLNFFSSLCRKNKKDKLAQEIYSLTVTPLLVLKGRIWVFESTALEAACTVISLTSVAPVIFEQQQEIRQGTEVQVDQVWHKCRPLRRKKVSSPILLVPNVLHCAWDVINRFLLMYIWVLK